MCDNNSKLKFNWRENMNFGIYSKMVVSNNGSELEVSTTDTGLINELVSIIMSQVNTGLEVERFIGLDTTQINISNHIGHGIVEEWNVHELQGVLPLESTPQFMQRIL